MALRPVSRQLYQRLNSPDFQPIDLVDIQLVGQDPAYAFHFTNAGQSLVWRGASYQPITLKVDHVEERAASTAGEASYIGLTIGNIDRQVAKLLAAADFDGAKIIAWRTDRRVLNDRGPMRLTMGEAREVTLSDTSLTCQVVTVLGQLERITIPGRLYQSHCNNVFGDQMCGVNTISGVDSNGAPIRYTTSVGAGSSLNAVLVAPSILTDAGNPADPSDFFDGAIVRLTDGVAGLQYSAVQRVDTFNGQARFWLRQPLRTLPTPGDPLIIQRSCKKTTDDCMLYRGDLTRFTGFRDVPPILFVPKYKYVDPTSP
jgi:hypothetical protein